MRSRVLFIPNLLGDNSIVVPPDPIPNSEVKRNRADGSVGSPHVRVGHRQAPNLISLKVKVNRLVREHKVSLISWLFCI